MRSRTRRRPVPKRVLKGLLPILSLAVLLAGCGPGASATTETSGASIAPSKAYTKAEVASLDPGVPLHGKPAPNFTLTDQFGKRVSLKSFRGKSVILTFDDDECTTICPLTSASLLLAQHALGPAASDVVLLGVNANPLHTAVADVKAFSTEHGLMNHWLFLTGSPANLKQVWKAYHLEVEILKGKIDHTPAVYVIGPNGDEQRLFLTSAMYGVVPLEAQALADAVAKTIPGHPKVSRVPQALGTPIGSPADRVTLPHLLGTGTATVGGRAPHLVVFFASWAPQVESQLDALNGYAAAAKASDLPPLTAVDVTSTEPSLSRAASLVNALASPPAYPVLTDRTGRFADAYGVQDIPWIALASGGKVVWSHDGWLPVKTLEKDVAKALAAP